MRVILTGATGAAGNGVLRASLLDPKVTQVTTITRKPLPPQYDPKQHPKLTSIIHKDYLNYPPELIERIRDHDSCIWALGASQSGMSEADYRVLTHDYTMAAFDAMKTMKEGSADSKNPFRFVFVSGDGAERKNPEKKFLLFARVKGETENDLVAAAGDAKTSPFRVHTIRPGYFFPSNPEDRVLIRPSFMARTADCLLGPVMRTVLPKSAIEDDTLGRAALRIARGEAGESDLFNNAQLKEIGK